VLRAACPLNSHAGNNNKFGGVIDRMNTELGSKFLYSFRIKTQLLKMLQRVIVVDGATTPKRMDPCR
jgi:hypothetical protein